MLSTVGSTRAVYDLMHLLESCSSGVVTRKMRPEKELTLLFLFHLFLPGIASGETVLAALLCFANDSNLEVKF